MNAELVNFRRQIHRHPEPAWQEYRTATLIARELDRMGYKVLTGIDVIDPGARLDVPPADALEESRLEAVRELGDDRFLRSMKGGLTGVVGCIQGGAPGPTVAVRVDMDALSVSESNSDQHRPVREGFASVRPGLMHACGHDGHVAIGWGLAQRLAAVRAVLPGRVKLIFQPAEEGGKGGARSIVAAGHLDDVDCFLAIHIGIQARTNRTVMPVLDGFLASTKLDALFLGESSHAAVSPEKGRNALLAAAAAALQLHALPRHGGGATRINVGVLNAGHARNVVPDRAEMSIEVRADSEDVEEFLRDAAERVLTGSAHAWNVDVSLRTVGRAPGARSDLSLCRRIMDLLSSCDLVDQVELCNRFGASEDATYMMRHVSGRGGRSAYILLGSELAAEHHHPEFDFDESVLEVGVEALYHLIVSGI